MKVQASGILILIACILTGCGKSMQDVEDVAGAYKTAEIKYGVPGTQSVYYFTTWVLDLAESGIFRLKENKFRGGEHELRPVNGSEVSGKWKLDRDSVICSWSETGNDFSLTLDVRIWGDMVGIVSRVYSLDNEGVSIISSVDEISNLRFKRVE